MGTYSQGAQEVGSTPTTSRDSGFLLAVKTVSLQSAAVASVDGVAYLPEGAQIVDVLLDSTVTHTSTTATVQGGTTVGGVELFPATDVKTSPGRLRPTLTVANLTALLALPHVSTQSDSPVNVRLALTGGTTTGTTKVHIVYAPKLG